MQSLNLNVNVKKSVQHYLLPLEVAGSEVYNPIPDTCSLRIKMFPFLQDLAANT